MKVTFEGKVNGEANVRGAGRGTSRPPGRTVRALRKDIRRSARRIRRELKKHRRELREVRRELRRDIRRDIHRELYSDRFARFLRAAAAGGEPFREIAQGLLNEAVRTETTAGPVSGTLVEVGEDYMVIRESANTILLVPFANVVSIRPL
ncbi:DUF2642 domain-containing protein [Paenibacillus antri]|uniref:DUF2642 domain-containing protein n=1 Tax=Paenibacillus antri TaxID=2582848 RepID=A0A5R9GD06_9BACL|nr:DUF2642 domain-containing protein [Paenibacillus antri]TLS51970.1 DUF2642 domain-containing protein [Paenibacillus antri]